MTPTLIKNVKRGDFFRLKNDENSPLWVRYDYNRAFKKFECYRYDDVCKFSLLKSDRVVFI